ncbi:MAG TPA: hypothetical protein VL913_00450 [Candidatus Micrarchaeaceae archaeon]|nr:hypothetical protein [Candidatus Micrarchaeaceae archaeon]
MTVLAGIFMNPVLLGVTITSLTVGTLAFGYFRARKRRLFPFYGWLGIFSLACAELLMLLRVTPVDGYFLPLAGSAYILIADAAVLALTGRSRLHSAPFAFARLAILSVPLYLVFEGYNLRVQNWIWVGIPQPRPAAMLAYVWNCATIFPALFETADLVQAILPPLPGAPWKIPKSIEYLLISCGAAFIILPLVLPIQVAAYCFGFVWIGFLFFLDPINRRLGLPSVLGDLSEGFYRRVYGFFLSGWICGILWEFWNFWSPAKWTYNVPILQNPKIFEMPVPGFFWFAIFSLECFVMYVTAAWLAGWLKRVR